MLYAQYSSGGTDHVQGSIVKKLWTLFCAYLTLVLVFAAAALRAEEEEKEIDVLDEDALIFEQMDNDMFLGSDDYFGEDTELAYADVATPENSKSDSNNKKPKPKYVVDNRRCFFFGFFIFGWFIFFCTPYIIR